MRAEGPGRDPDAAPTSGTTAASKKHQELRQERDEVKKGPDEGIYIYGLYLDCAKWDKEKNRLADSDPKVCY